jgi:hypothetical protein
MSEDRRQNTEDGGQRDMLGSWKAWMVKPKKEA